MADQLRQFAFARDDDVSAASALRLSPAQEQVLQRRLKSWARTHMQLPESEFDDLYQGGWRKLLEKAQRTGPTRNLEGALRWGILNTWREECRRRRRHPVAALDDAPEAALMGSEHASPSAYIERLEAARYLFEAVGSLTERQRMIVLLADVWDVRPGEVCAELGVSERTYQRDHARALAVIASHVAALLNGDWCAQHRALMVAYARGRSGGGDAQAARRHLANCSSCRALVAAVRRVGAAERSAAHALPAAA